MTDANSFHAGEMFWLLCRDRTDRYTSCTVKLIKTQNTKKSSWKLWKELLYINLFYLFFLFFRASTTSSQTRMSTSDLRGVGISAPTGFVHVSGYNRNFGGRCGSVSETLQQQQQQQPPLVEENDNNSANSVTAMSQPPSRDHSSCRSRMRELSNIDPKFTSQVSNIFI